MTKPSYRVLGALGEGTFAPVLAERHWAGRHCRVVLTRPAPALAAAASACPSFRVVAEHDQIELEGQRFGVQDFAAGCDLHQLMEQASLSREALAAIEAQALLALEACGCPHGDLSGASIRIGVDGVRLVGFTGRQGDDRAALRELLAELEDEAAESGSLADRLQDLPPMDLRPHPWTGRSLQPGSDAPGPPPKARAAAFAGVTLILGLAAGRLLFGG